MERLNKKLSSAEKAFHAFTEALLIHQPNSFERDAAILRFDFTFETCWKVAKEILYVVDGIELNSPKTVIRASRQVGMLDAEQAQIALSMADDRNLSVHTYNEELSLEIYKRLFSYRAVFEVWLSQMKQRATSVQ